MRPRPPTRGEIAAAFRHGEALSGKPPPDVVRDDAGANRHRSTQDFRADQYPSAPGRAAQRRRR